MTMALNSQIYKSTAQKMNHELTDAWTVSHLRFLDELLKQFEAQVMDGSAKPQGSGAQFSLVYQDNP